MQRADDRDTDVLVLVGRLNAGWIVCEQETEADRKARLEDHWITLLHQYEAACDRVDLRSKQKPDDRFSFSEGLA